MTSGCYPVSPRAQATLECVYGKAAVRQLPTDYEACLARLRGVDTPATRKCDSGRGASGCAATCAVLCCRVLCCAVMCCSVRGF